MILYEPPEAFLFDLDGVLIDTEPLHSEAWLRTAKVFGTNLLETQLMLLRGRRRIDCAKEILQWIKTPVELDEFLEVHKPISKKLLSSAKEMPGAETLIRWCHDKKLPTALVTSSTSKSVALKTTSHSWLKLIDIEVLGDDIFLKAGKPSPEPFLLAAKRLEVDISKCWALEDSQSGKKSALAAGCYVWLLKDSRRNNLETSQDKSSDNLSTIDHLNEVIEQLKLVY